MCQAPESWPPLQVLKTWSVQVLQTNKLHIRMYLLMSHNTTCMSLLIYWYPRLS